jgi:RNA polymerase sigma factor (TIGR02999 family)
MNQRGALVPHLPPRYRRITIMGEEPPPRDPLRMIDPALYEELRRIAERALRDETRTHAPSPTSVVHEIWLRLARSESTPATSHEHALSLASLVARRVLVDAARNRLTLKRGGSTRPRQLPEHLAGREPDPAEVIAIDDLLSKLAERHPRQSKALEMRMFGDIDSDRIGEALSISPSQAKRDIAFARAWLAERLARVTEHPQ